MMICQCWGLLVVVMLCLMWGLCGLVGGAGSCSSMLVSPGGDAVPYVGSDGDEGKGSDDFSGFGSKDQTLVRYRGCCTACLMPGASLSS